MKRDSIFYKLFKKSPTLLFELVPQVPDNADHYRFESIAVKEPTFQMDGVLLPPEGSKGTVFIVEVQFQKIDNLYERIFAETAMYFHRNYKEFSDWQVIVIYPNQKVEQDRLHPHRSLLNGDQLHRIYLDRLGNIRELPLWVALMVLTTTSESEAPEEARYLIEQTQQVESADETRAIIEMVTTIISYKFKKLTPEEVETMLDITFEETRVYRELKKRAEQEGLSKGLSQGLSQGLEKGLSQGLSQGLEEGRKEGRKEEAASLVTRMLTKRFGSLEDSDRSSIATLPLEKLEELSEALLDFSDLSELKDWLKKSSNLTSM